MINPLSLFVLGVILSFLKQNFILSFLVNAIQIHKTTLIQRDHDNIYQFLDRKLKYPHHVQIQIKRVQNIVNLLS